MTDVTDKDEGGQKCNPKSNLTKETSEKNATSSDICSEKTKKFRNSKKNN